MTTQQELLAVCLVTSAIVDWGTSETIEMCMCERWSTATSMLSKNEKVAYTRKRQKSSHKLFSDPWLAWTIANIASTVLTVATAHSVVSVATVSTAHPDNGVGMG